VYVCPQVGLDFFPNESWYAVPVTVHATVDPSPMAQTTRSTSAVADTVKPPADADLVIGPHVSWFGFCTHIQVGIPTIPMLPGRLSGTIPIVIAFNRIDSTARWANTRGSGGGGATGAATAQSWRVIPAMNDPGPILGPTKQS